MRIASLADIHLGANLPGRRERGRSVRQVDVERALDAACTAIIERQPDLVTIAGDVFDTATPPLAAVDAFLLFLRRVTDRSPARVVIVGGNHETPRTVGVLSPNALAMRFSQHVQFLAPGESVSGHGYRVHGYGCSYLSRPDAVVPEPEAGVLNIMLIHAAVRSSARPGAVPAVYAGPEAYDVARADGFDVVACGDFHEFRVLNQGRYGEVEGEYQIVEDEDRQHGPLAFYSGSIERTSSNMWSETAPKGFVFVDTDARTLEFVEVPTRPMLDSDLDHFGEPTAENVNRFLSHLLDDADTADAILRLTVKDFPRSEKDGIDWRLVNALRTRCVHFRFDLRLAAAEQAEFVDRRSRGVHSVAGDAELFFKDDEPPVRRACFDALGLAVPAAEEVGHA